MVKVARASGFALSEIKAMPLREYAVVMKVLTDEARRARMKASKKKAGF